MSLLTIIEEAMLESGFDAPDSIIGTEDTLVKRFLAFANLEVLLLTREYAWSGARVIATLTGDGTSTTYNLPDDFYKFSPGNRIWVDETPTYVLKLVTPQEMLQTKVSTVTPLYPVWHRFGDQIEFYPAPKTTDVFKFEYQSEYGVISADGATRRKTFSTDTDTTIPPEHVVKLGVIWRYKRSIGLDYAEEMQTYEIEKAREKGANTPRPSLSLRGVKANPFGGTTVSYPGVIEA